ncbi:MAG: exodeoxyribonuclease III [Pseudomonadales bacterium]|nr:exodeoxyribonuclease III [Pseudomonadales bacterium]
MRVVSFNVNSIRVRLHQLEAVISAYEPDFIGLQETKATDADFPVEAINDLGYEVAFHGQKTHYGVALLSKRKPVKIVKGFPDDDDSSQRRFISGTFELADQRQLTVINGYYPQGEKRSHATKFPAKQKYYKDVLAFLDNNCSPKDPVIVMGDMNVAPLDLDIGIGEPNAKRWLKDGKTSFLPEEREWLSKITHWGLFDTFRHHHPEVDDLFSWFDYRSRGFEREPKRGLRIDLILASECLQTLSSGAGIDYTIRAMDKPSDHCPLWAEFDLKVL